MCVEHQSSTLCISSNVTARSTTAMKKTCKCGCTSGRSGTRERLRLVFLSFFLFPFLIAGLKPASLSRLRPYARRAIFRRAPWRRDGALKGVNHGRLLHAAQCHHLVSGEQSGHYNLLSPVAPCPTIAHRLESSREELVSRKKRDYNATITRAEG